MYILNPEEYHLVHNLVKAVPFNTLFAQAVLVHKVSGTVYTDGQANPQTCLIFHPYGILLLCGKCDNPVFNQALADFMLNSVYRSTLWLQVFPQEWLLRLEPLLGSRLKTYPQGANQIEADNKFKDLNRQNVVKCARVNFAFDRRAYQSSAGPKIPGDTVIRRIDRTLYENMPGSIIARNFWNSYADFSAGGVGFCLMRGDTVLSTCATAFVVEKQFEIGIETDPDYRGRRYAELAARAFCDYCLENGLEPVWACRKQNLASYRLAERLGFRPVREVDCYALVNNRQ